ncbi:hypothetical protein [Lichenicoccus sp.]|uniref:hypothetical protein n=1 Tax=Lichenicoccus sp. TaxID=2781899 RepID=UPI003D10F543
MITTTTRPVRTIEAFRALDDGEILIGYMDGFSGLPLADGHSPSYLHGWRNGMIESARLRPDQAYLDLQRAFEHGQSTT